MEKDEGLEAIQRANQEAEAWEILRLTGYAEVDASPMEDLFTRHFEPPGLEDDQPRD